MPKLSESAMAARRQSILEASRRVFARKGFHATTIADVCREAGVSAGGLYTHFPNKHAIVAALGSDATREAGSLDLIALYRALQRPPGESTAQLDLQLWAASAADETLRQMVIDAMDAFRDGLRVPGRSGAQIVLLEALALGLEVQRALGRPGDPRFEAELENLVNRSDQ